MCSKKCDHIFCDHKLLYIKKTDEFKFYIMMLCLHGEEAASIQTENGKFWHCNREEKCLANCYADDYDLYDKAIKAFLATHQKIPTCCMGEKTRHQARMKVVRDMEKRNFGRPFFVCPNENDPCRYFAWGDQTIVETPLCKHGKPSRLLSVKKEGPNKDRRFLVCNEKKENQCKFFRWYHGPDPEDPLLPGCITLFSMPPSYKYTLKKNGAMFTSSHSDRKKAYEEFVKNNEKTDKPSIHNDMHIKFLRAAGCIPPDVERNLFGNPTKSVLKHADDDDDDENPKWEPLTNTFQGTMRPKKNPPMKRTGHDDGDENEWSWQKKQKRAKTDE